MPPDGSLTKDEINRIEKWIAEGAATPDTYGPAEAVIELTHWSFLPIAAAPESSIDSPDR